MLARRWQRAAMLLCGAIASVMLLRAAGQKVGPPTARGSGPASTRMASSQCVSCHRIDTQFSHPVNVTPLVSMTVPAGLPLEDGRVTCVTCHEDGDEAHARSRTAETPGSLLRAGYEEAAVLCTACHTAYQVSRQTMHPLGATAAHLMWSAPALGAEQLAAADRREPSHFVNNAGTTEDGSRKCLSCHDGTVARDVTSDGPLGDKGHPVARQYGGPQTRKVEMKPERLLDKRVRLFNGQIGCESCHSPYSTLPNLLVIPNNDSKLCLSCHDI